MFFSNLVKKLVKNLGYVVTLVLTVFLLLFILPNFSFQVGDRTLNWNGVDLSAFGVNSTLANFHLGTDLYPQKQVVILASYTDQDVVNQRTVFLRDAQLVNQRLDAAGIKDVRVITRVSEDNFSLALEFPSTYSDIQASSIASVAASPGVIQFWSHNATGEETTATEPINSTLLPQIAPEYKPMVANISTSDLTGIAVETRSNLLVGEQLGTGTVWRLRFRDEAASRVNSTIFQADQQSPALMAIDGEPMFVVQGIAGSSEALAIPLFINDNLQLKLMSTYLTVAGTVSGTLQSADTVTQPAVYSPEGKRVVAIAILAMLIVITISYLTKYGLRESMPRIWAFGFILLLAVGLLKLGAATLSVVLVISTVIWILFAKYAVNDISNALDIELRLKHYRNLSLWIFLVLLVLANSGYLFGVLQEFALVNAIFAFSLLVCSVFFYKFILIEKAD